MEEQHIECVLFSFKWKTKVSILYFGEKITNYYYKSERLEWWWKQQLIIKEVLKKCPDLNKKAKTVADRKSASRSSQEEEKNCQ